MAFAFGGYECGGHIVLFTNGQQSRNIVRQGLVPFLRNIGGSCSLNGQGQLEGVTADSAPRAGEAVVLKSVTDDGRQLLRHLGAQAAHELAVVAHLNTVNETAVGGLQLVRFQGQDHAAFTAGRQDAVQVFGVFLLVEHLHRRALGQQGRAGRCVVEGEEGTGCGQGEHTGALHVHAAAFSTHGNGGKLQVRDGFVTGGDHAGNGIPVRGGVCRAHAAYLEFVNVDGNAIGLVGVIRFGNEARFTVPDTFTVDVQFLKDLEGFCFVVIIGDNVNATAVTECVIDH